MTRIQYTTDIDLDPVMLYIKTRSRYPDVRASSLGTDTVPRVDLGVDLGGAKIR